MSVGCKCRFFPLTGFEGPLRGGGREGKRKEWRGKEKEKRKENGSDGKKHPRNKFLVMALPALLPSAYAMPNLVLLVVFDYELFDSYDMIDDMLRFDESNIRHQSMIQARTNENR